MAHDVFSEPPRRAHSKNPIFFFSRFLGLGHLQGLGVTLGRIFGVVSIEPFWGDGGVRPEGPIEPPLPAEPKTRPPLWKEAEVKDGDEKVDPPAPARPPKALPISG